MLTRRLWLLPLLGVGIMFPSLAISQQKLPPLSPRAAAPKSEPVAETRLLMEGIAQPNYTGLERMMKEKPDEQAAWNFARGQALLIAETGNLLLLRPPKAQGQDTWNRSAVELRDAATRLARATAAQDLNTSRSRLVEVANACNRCHQNFGVKIKLSPFAAEKPAPMLP